MENQSKSCVHKDPIWEAKLDVKAGSGSLGQSNETKRFYANSLALREIKSLVAISDTLVPSINSSGVGHVDDTVSDYLFVSAVYIDNALYTSYMNETSYITHSFFFFLWAYI